MAHNPARYNPPKSIMQAGYEAKNRIDDRLGMGNDVPYSNSMPGEPVPETDWELRAQLAQMENNHHGYGNYRHNTMFHGEPVDESLTARGDSCVEEHFGKRGE